MIKDTDQHFDMLLVIGDWSDDGHCQSTNFGIRANKSIAEIQTAYKASCKLTGLSFNHNDDFTGRDYDWRTAKLFYVATEYEEAFISDTTYDELEKLKCPLLDRFIKQNYEDYQDGPILREVYMFDNEDPFKHFIELWWWFVTLSLPSLEYTMALDFVSSDPVMSHNLEPINGFWNDNLNVQFGYGLYNI